jgi:hypothetical protein
MCILILDPSSKIYRQYRYHIFTSYFWLNRTKNCNYLPRDQQNVFNFYFFRKDSALEFLEWPDFIFAQMMIFIIRKFSAYLTEIFPPSKKYV